MEQQHNEQKNSYCSIVISAGGAIGLAITQQLSVNHPNHTIYAFSGKSLTFDRANITSHTLDITDESSIVYAASIITETPKHIIVATGMLHDKNVMPEKSLKDLSSDKFHQLFAINTIAPALIAKHFLPLLPRDERSVFAALSARVGSISDNRLGGWYAYRASKAALNMILKNAAIETTRKHPKSIIVGLHPGTVDSDLSKPFQGHVPDGQLFTPDHSASCLLNVINSLTPEHTGKCFDWDGKEIMP